jgi:dTDP-4-amino-4,6-dideoxy-D-galactose acyltransferase
VSEANLKADAWLTHRLGKPSFHLMGNIGALSSNRSSITDRLAGKPLFVDAKIPVADMSSIEAAERMGFALIETNVRFAMPLSDVSSKSAPGVTFATSEMADAIGEIAATSFSEDRFHRDPAIPQSTADELKRGWATNFFNGERGDWMVVSRVDDRLVGFLQLLRMQDGGLLIDLIAVSARERGRGLARAMIRFACRNCGCVGQVTVGTAIANTRSIRLYQSMGFRLCDAQYVFHHHGAAC